MYDVFCLAGIAQQAQQSTHLAEGLNPLQLNYAPKLHAHSVQANAG